MAIADRQEKRNLFWRLGNVPQPFSSMSVAKHSRLQGATPVDGLCPWAAASVVASTALEAAGLVTGSKRLSHAAAAATLVGGALLRWGVVQAGQASARDRDGQLEAMKPTSRAPDWGPSRRQ